MQYLLKITIKDTNCWRLIAVDGSADIAHVAQLIALAFDYEEGEQSFTVNDKNISAGNGGRAIKTEELNTFDYLNLDTDDEFIYQHEKLADLKHIVRIMKKEDHLFCLMPSCLVGSGLLPKDTTLNSETINNYLDSDDMQSLDLREVTNRLRAFGSKRKDVNEAMVSAGAAPIVFKVGK